MPTGSVDLSPIGGEIVCVILLLFLVPFTIFAGLSGAKRQRDSQERMKAFDLQSDEFLAWDERNFRLSRDEIESVEVVERPHPPRQMPVPHELCLHLRDGAVRRWRVPSRRVALELKQALPQPKEAVLRPSLSLPLTSTGWDRGG